LDPSGSVTFRPHMRGVYEAMARRDDIARRVEELLVEVQEWADEDGSDEARDVLDALEDLAERLGEPRSEEHTSELQSRENLVCRLLLEKKKNMKKTYTK